MEETLSKKKTSEARCKNREGGRTGKKRRRNAQPSLLEKATTGLLGSTQSSSGKGKQKKIGPHPPVSLFSRGKKRNIWSWSQAENRVSSQKERTKKGNEDQEILFGGEKTSQNRGGNQNCSPKGTHKAPIQTKKGKKTAVAKRWGGGADLHTRKEVVGGWGDETKNQLEMWGSKGPGGGKFWLNV